MICVNCRKVFSTENTYCSHCGTKAFRKKEFAVPEFPIKPQDRKETTLQWLKKEFQLMLKLAPKKLVMIGAYSLVILLINIVFWWWLNPAFLAFPLNRLVNLIVFLTATYNDIIPKTIYWVLIFAFYRQLVIRMIRKGLPRTFSHMKLLVPIIKKGIQDLQYAAYSFLLVGGGLGLVIANNFASYSRFSEARNKFDKYFVVVVICFAILYSLNRSMNTGFFKFIKLLVKDMARVLRRPVIPSDVSLNLFFVGFVLGSFLDLPLILLRLKYGGYILGALAVISGIVLYFLKARPKEVKYDSPL